MLQELHLKLLELYGLNAMDHPHGDQWPDRAFLREEPLCVVAWVVPVRRERLVAGWRDAACFPHWQASAGSVGAGRRR